MRRADLRFNPVQQRFELVAIDDYREVVIDGGTKPKVYGWLALEAARPDVLEVWLASGGWHLYRVDD